jgi:glycosyltransferase involved in cell wall biosynthesis
MEIAFVVPYFSGFGSNESELVEEFIKKGHDVCVFTTNIRSGSRLKNIKYSLNHKFNIKYIKVIYNFQGFPLTIDFSDQLKDFDLIMAQEDYQYTSYIAYLAAKKYNIKIIVSNERYYLPSFPKSCFLKIIEALFTSKLRNYVDFITVHSNSAKNYLKKIGFKKDIYIIPTPINLSKFKIRKSDLIREKYKFNKNDLIVLTIGRLVPFKNYYNLIAKFGKLPMNYRLVIIGNGVLKSFFKEYIINNNIKNIILEDNFINPELIKEYINSADIYIQPSLVEPFGIAVREAMALGKPLLVTKEGGLIESIDDNGYFISKDLKNLKQKIDACYKNKIIFSKKSLELIKTYDVRKVSDKYLKLI